MSQYEHTNAQGKTYYLNCKDVKLRGWKIVPIHFFTLDAGRPTAVEELPNDFEILENPRNGFLSIRRKGADEL